MHHQENRVFYHSKYDLIPGISRGLVGWVITSEVEF